MNAQTLRLADHVAAGRSLQTLRRDVLAQVVFCEGCCCGQTARGFAPLPRDWIKQQWKLDKLNSAVQLTISGCLGPCDLANVCCILTPDGITWLGGLSEHEHYRLLVDWARHCRVQGRRLPLPQALDAYRFDRFLPPYSTDPACSGPPEPQP